MFNFWGLAKVYTAFSAGKDAGSIYIDTFNFQSDFGGLPRSSKENLPIGNHH